MEIADPTVDSCNAQSTSASKIAAEVSDGVSFKYPSMNAQISKYKTLY